MSLNSEQGRDTCSQLRAHKNPRIQAFPTKFAALSLCLLCIIRTNDVEKVSEADYFGLYHLWDLDRYRLVNLGFNGDLCVRKPNHHLYDPSSAITLAMCTVPNCFLAITISQRQALPSV
jgi:hypothetical protein